MGLPVWHLYICVYVCRDVYTCVCMEGVWSRVTPWQRSSLRRSHRRASRRGCVLGTEMSRYCVGPHCGALHLCVCVRAREYMLTVSVSSDLLGSFGSVGGVRKFLVWDRI